MFKDGYYFTKNRNIVIITVLSTGLIIGKKVNTYSTDDRITWNINGKVKNSIFNEFSPDWDLDERIDPNDCPEYFI